MDWFLYDNGLRHERVKRTLKFAEAYLGLSRTSMMEPFCKNSLTIKKAPS